MKCTRIADNAVLRSNLFSNLNLDLSTLQNDSETTSSTFNKLMNPKNIKLMSSTQCKDTKSYEHVNEHTTGRNILTEYYTQQENADSIKLQINLVSDIFLGFISLLNVDEVVSLSFCKVERSRFRFGVHLLIDLKTRAVARFFPRCAYIS
jgi:hypothetical protein